MRLFLVRHGQSEGNVAENDPPEDPPLTKLGRLQAARAGAALSAQGVDLVYCSPTRRALATAWTIAEVIRAPVCSGIVFSESDRGVWFDPARASLARKRGLTAREVESAFPETLLLDTPEALQDWWDMLDAEDCDKAYERGRRAIGCLRERHTGINETVALVSHGAFGSALMSVALETGPALFNRYSQYNCGISLLHFSAEGCRARYINSVEHLSPDQRTDPTS